MEDPTQSPKFLYALIGGLGLASLLILAACYNHLVTTGETWYSYEILGYFAGFLCLLTGAGGFVHYMLTNTGVPKNLRKIVVFILILLVMEAGPLILILDGRTDIWLNLYLLGFLFALSLSLLQYIDHKIPGYFASPDSLNLDPEDPTYISWWDRNTRPTGQISDWNVIYHISKPGFVNAAILFSFIVPGLGQTYNGQYLKGGIILCTSMLTAFFFGPMAFAVWLIGTIDAGLTAREIIAGKIPKPVNGVWVGAHMCTGGVALVSYLLCLSRYFM
jgi:TM2 domain-containing membrane protein YozV